MIHSRVHLHLVADKRYLLDGNISPNLILLDNLFVEDIGRAFGEDVALQLSRLFVGLDKVAQQRRLLLCDDSHVDVGARAQVVKDARHDGIAGELDGLVLGQAGLPLRLKDAHGGEAAAAHGDVGELVGAAVGVDGEEVGARGVAAGDDEVGANVALVAEEVLLEHRHAGDDAGLAACREGVQLELRGDERRRELGVGGRAGAGAPDLGGDVVQLLAVFVGDDWAGCGSCIGSNLEKRNRWLRCMLPELREKERDRKRITKRTTTPPSYMQPTMVVPVLVALGRGTPRECRAALRL